MLNMVDVFVGLGSNLGDSRHTLKRAWTMLGEQEGIELEKLSNPYVSAPVGMDSLNWFTNAVGHLKTDLSAHQLLKILLETEQSLGRIRNEGDRGYQDRVVDLDLLYYGTLIHNDPRLTVPHPHLSQRLFVLEPLASIAPEFIDPERKISAAALYHLLKNMIDSETIEKQEIQESEW